MVFPSFVVVAVAVVAVAFAFAFVLEDLFRRDGCFSSLERLGEREREDVGEDGLGSLWLLMVLTLDVSMLAFLSLEASHFPGLQDVAEEEWGSEVTTVVAEETAALGPDGL